MAIKNLILCASVGSLGGASSLNPIGCALSSADVATVISGMATIGEGQQEIIEENKYGTGTLTTVIGTSVTIAGSTVCDKACDYFDTQAYVETLDEEQVETALNDLGVSFDEPED